MEDNTIENLNAIEPHRITEVLRRKTKGKAHTFSTDAKATAQRIKYLTDDNFAAKNLDNNRRYKNRLRQQKFIYSTAILNSRNSKAKINVVKRHLAKGRNSGDIAVREYMREEDVKRIIEQIQKESNETQLQTGTQLP